MELHRTRGSGIGDLVTLVRKPKLNPTSPDRVHRELESATRQADPAKVQWWKRFALFALLGFLAVVGVGLIIGDEVVSIYGGWIAGAAVVFALARIARWSESPQRAWAIAGAVILSLPLLFLLLAFLVFVAAMSWQA